MTAQKAITSATSGLSQMVTLSDLRTQAKFDSHTLHGNHSSPRSSMHGKLEKPDGFETGTNTLNWAVILPAGSSGMKIRVISNYIVWQIVGGPGLNLARVVEVKG
ncbi:hypothetical protein HO173_011106 [Letharia columbiana]|uniref:Uncharacterized protein n=1 Tax=Letharia columbiana TaxID=112416 RepID=A0A8H6FL89_9LECA|nr:uncharacterized protein HO173_011106 [Letharia columbiana]KAF6230569.1 hypothetical protein HO173_011106 [Letharia columbiana]